MKSSKVLVYPTDVGYVFEPSAEGGLSARILSSLRPDSGEIAATNVLSPCLRAEWLSGFSMLPRHSVLCLAGLQTRDTRSPLDRGSGSVWAAAEVFESITTPTAEKIAEQLESLVSHLASSILATGKAAGFTAAARQHLVEMLGKVAVQQALDTLRTTANTRAREQTLPILRKSSIFRRGTEASQETPPK